jgi:hypothetical protein
MNLEQLSTMTEAELQAKANEHLGQLALPTVQTPIATDMHMQQHVSQAQFFLAEIERRKQAKERIESERIAARDYKLELWVIGLIGAELVLALFGIIVGWVEGSKQMDVLDKLSKSGAETVATLTALQKEQEAALETQKNTLQNITAMNQAQQAELDVNFTGALRFTGVDSNQESLHFSLRNDGKASLFLWGMRFNGQPKQMYRKALELGPGDPYPIYFENLRKKLIGDMNEGAVFSPFEIYLKSPNGEKYIAKSTVFINVQGDFITVFCRPVTIVRGSW